MSSEAVPASSRYDEIRALVGSVNGVVHDVVGALERLCTAVAARLEVSGAAVTLSPADGLSRVAAATDERSRARSELQLTTGEGPCADAFAQRRPVLVADLDAAAARWPGYTAAAREAGLRAIFAFPLRVGGAGLGVLEILSDEPGSLRSDRLTDALIFAQLATDTVLQARLTTPGGDLEPGLASAMDHHWKVHQAQGMLMVALDVSLVEAMALMRSYAFAHGLSLIKVALRVHAGDHLEADPGD